MAEEQNGANGNGTNENAGGGGNDGQSSEPSIQVIGQYLKDLSFESPKAPVSLKSPGENPNLHIDINVNITKLGENEYESAIQLKSHASNDDGTIYMLEVVYAGAFQIKNLPEDALEPVLLINCPTILYPFLRRIISEMTQEGGFPPLLLDPIDFATLYKQRKSASEPVGTA